MIIDNTPEMSSAIPIRTVSTTHSGARFRYGPWRGSTSIAQVISIGGGIVDHGAVGEISDLLLNLGFHEILTAALGPSEQTPFLEAGYRTHEPLHLLELDLRPEIVSQSSHRTRRMRQQDVALSLAIDVASFTSFWQFDAASLGEAFSATQTSRRRVVRSGKAVLGYAVTGRSDQTGFIQRLAVDPDARRIGVGSSLIADGLSWLYSKGARSALVNTQPDNEAALSLYEQFGFVEHPGGLAVLRLEGSPPRLRCDPNEETS